MSASINPWLAAGGMLSAIAALLHLGCIVFGASWYRALGAGERMAQLAESGSGYPTRITLLITVVLLVWAAYAFSGAGLGPRLPLLKAALCAITAVYLLRGAFWFSAAPVFPGQQPDLLGREQWRLSADWTGPSGRHAPSLGPALSQWH